MNTSSCIINTRTETLLVTELRLANTFLTRFIGLLGSKPLSAQQGLLIAPCNQIHTHFMRYSIDAVFMNKQFEVLYIYRQMAPWRISKYIKSAHYVLELSHNAAHSLQVGDVLKCHAHPHSPS